MLDFKKPTQKIRAEPIGPSPYPYIHPYTRAFLSLCHSSPPAIPSSLSSLPPPPLASLTGGRSDGGNGVDGSHGPDPAVLYPLQVPLRSQAPPAAEIGDEVLEDKLKRQFPDLMKSGEAATETELEYQMPKEVTDIIFRGVRLLINVSIRCTRNSHAKQLARGGELTTIVWILAEHARILRVKKTTKRKPTDSYDGLGIYVSRY